MASEWGPSNPPAALQAGALAVKQYAWYYTRVWRGGRDAAGGCYDVRDDGIDQVYNPSKAPAAAHLAAVAATWPLSLRRSGSFFPTGYRSGAGACGTAAWSGRLLQHDAADCARRLGETSEQILRRFYGSIEWVWPGFNDMTGDGRGDVTIVQGATDGTVTARLLTTDPAALAVASANASSSHDVIPPGAKVLGHAAADVDGDGRRDILINGFHNRPASFSRISHPALNAAQFGIAFQRRFGQFQQPGTDDRSIPPDLGDLMQVQFEILASFQDFKALCIGFHQAIFDAIMHHLDKVP